MANTTLGTLLLALKADTTAFSKGLGDAKKLAFDSGSAIVDSMKKVADSVGKLKFDSLETGAKSLSKLGGIAAGIGISVATAVIAVSKHVGEQATEIEKLSQSYGIAVETISSLRVAAKLIDVPLEQMTIGMGKLAKTAAAVTEKGSESGNIFQRLGVTVADSHGRLRPMDALLGDIADKFSAMQDGTSKTAFSMQVFGKSGAALIPFLNEGRIGIQRLRDISDELGMTWSAIDVQAAAGFKEQIELLELRGQAFEEQLARGVIPALNTLAAAFLRGNESGGSMARAMGESVGTIFIGIAKAVETVGVGIDVFLLKMKMAWQWAQDHSPKAMLSRAFTGAKVGGENADTKAQIDQLMIQYGTFLNQMDKLSSDLKSHGSGPVPGFGPAEDVAKLASELHKLSEKTRNLLNKEEGDKLATEISNIGAHLQELEAFKGQHPERIWAGINDQVNRLNVALTDLKGKQDAILRGLLEAGMRKSIEGVLSIPVATAGVSGEAQFKQQMLKLQIDVNEQNRQALSLYESTRTASERYANEVQRLNLLKQSGKIDEETYDRALEKTREDMGQGIDPMVRYQRELRSINELVKTGAITDQQRWLMSKEALDQYNRSMDELQMRSGKAMAGIQVFTRQTLEYSKNWAAQTYNAMSSVFSGLQGSIRQFGRDMLYMSKSVGQIFGDLGMSIVETMADALLEILARWIITHTVMKAVSSLFHTEDAAETAAVNAVKVGTTIAANVIEGLSYAAVGAAAAGASVAAIPVVGWAMVPEVAAATYGILGGFAALASAAGGMDVDRDQLVQVHKKEMIIPARISDTIRDLASMARPAWGQTPAVAGGYSGPIQPANVNVYGAKDPEVTGRRVADIVTANIKRMLKDRGYKG